jgi:serine/threonine protein kinase
MKCPKCQTENPPDSSFCRKCATPLPSAEELVLTQTKTLVMPPAELERGTTFSGRYEVIEELGKGGMGKVYKVFDTKIKEVVALKLIRPEISTDEKTIERFNNELRLARKISHRHVCRMYDLGEEGTSRFITMEYVPGEDLKRFIKRSGQLTVSKAVSIAKQICEGLAEAHHIGVIHRDLKPQNIMIDADGNTRIMDFGIARFLEGEGVTTQGVLIGTPDYMSPEQTEMEGVDQRSDIYALGVILFEMVTGRVPFEGKTPISIAMKHKSEPPPDPRNLNPQVTDGLSQVILKCMQKEKRDRYQSAEELLADLKNIEEGLPTTEKIIPPAKPKPQTSKGTTVTFDTKKLLVRVAAMIIILAGTVLVWRLIPRREVEPSSKGSANIIVPPSPPEIKKETVITKAQKESKKESETVGREGTGTREQRSVSPEIRWLIPQDVEKYLDASKYSKDAQWLMRTFNLLGPEVIRHLGKDDLKGIENFLENIKKNLPEEGDHRAIIDQIKGKLQEGQKLQEEGKQEEAQKSYREGQTQMQKLLEIVRDKEDADRAKTSMEQARMVASRRLEEEEDNLLYRVAQEKVEDATDAYEESDFAGSKTLYTILARIFAFSIEGCEDNRCIEVLKNFVDGLRMEAIQLDAPSSESASWYFEHAKEEEEEAVSCVEEDDLEDAAERYIQAAFLYEKAKEKASEDKTQKR